MVRDVASRFIYLTFHRHFDGFLDQLWSSHLLSFPDDRGSDFGLFLLPLGRPPSLPLTLDVAALRLLVVSPRQAGQ